VLSFPIVDGQPVLPIEPVQILWLNLVATVTLALPLAVEAKEPGLMRRPPRDSREPLLTRFVVVRTVYVGILMSAVAIALFVGVTAAAGGSLLDGRLPDAGILAEAQTLAVTALAFFQIFYLLTCRTLAQPVREIGWWSNPQVFVGIGILLVLQGGFVHLPFMQDLFRTAALDPGQWLLAALAGAVVVPVVMVEKAVRRRAGSSGPG
jgi:magnesium-transporting ATPase (P-type)